MLKNLVNWLLCLFDFVHVCTVSISRQIEGSSLSVKPTQWLFLSHSPPDCLTAPFTQHVHKQWHPFTANNSIRFHQSGLSVTLKIMFMAIKQSNNA